MKFSEVPSPRISFKCSVNPLPAEYSNGDNLTDPLYRGIRVSTTDGVYVFNPPNSLDDTMTDIPHLVSNIAGQLDLSVAPTENMLKLPIFTNGRMFAVDEVASKGSILYDETLDRWFKYTKEDTVVGNMNEDFVENFNFVGYIESEKGFLRINETGGVWTSASSLGTVSEDTDEEGYPQVCILDPETMLQTCYYYYENETYLNQSHSKLNDQLESGDFVKKGSSYYQYSGSTLTMSDHTVDFVMDSIENRVYVNDPNLNTDWVDEDPQEFKQTGDTFTELDPGVKFLIGNAFYTLLKVPESGNDYYKSVNNGVIDIDTSSDLWLENSPKYQLMFTDRSGTGVVTEDDTYIEADSSLSGVNILDELKNQFDNLKDDNKHNFANYVEASVDSINEELVLVAQMNDNDEWQFFQVAAESNMSSVYEEVV